MSGTLLVAVLKARAGDPGAAVRALRGMALPVGGHDYRSLFTTCLSAELAAVTGDETTGAAALRWLEPFSGRLGSLGSTCALGPVDSFIALACDAAGDDRGDAFADRAVELSKTWAVPKVADWLTGTRAAQRG